MQKYANILFDDAFKVVVCAPGNEELLIKIIELMVPGKRICKLELRDKENHGLSVSDKITTFDLFCTSETGEQFIVEMQFSPQNNYADRMLCYATYPIRAQLTAKLAQQKDRLTRSEKVNKMDYGLLPVYVISLLNFSIKHEGQDALEEGLISRYSIRNERNGESMTESLRFVYLELGRLKIGKGEPEKCRTPMERFAYSLKYMHELEERPANFEDEVLKLLYSAAEFANMTVEQQTEYETVMRTELDIIAEKNYARESGYAEGRAAGQEQGIAEGRAEGLLEGQRQTIKALLTSGMFPEEVQQRLKLTAEDWETIMSGVDTE